MVIASSSSSSDCAKKARRDARAPLTSPYFRSALTRGAKARAERAAAEVLLSMAAMSLSPAPAPRPPCGGYLFLPDLVELQHMCYSVDQAIGEAAARLGESLEAAGGAFSELACAHAAFYGDEDEDDEDCRSDEGEVIWPPAMRERQSSAEYIDELIARTKALILESRAHMDAVAGARLDFPAFADPADAAAAVETERWLAEKAAELAAARFAVPGEGRDICIVFDKLARSFLEFDCTSRYRDEVQMRVFGETTNAASASHQKIRDTAGLLHEVGQRYVSDERYVYIYKMDGGPRGALAEAHIHATDSLLFVWLTFNL